MTRKFQRVAVLMGGWWSEREVSLSGGTDCANALRSAGYDVTEIDVDRDIAATLAEVKPEAVFNGLHGPFGEDGCIQGMLEFMNIPYTHSGVLASAAAMDKAVAKKIFKDAGIPIAEHRIVKRSDAAKEHAMKPPYVIKPIADGSSFGVFIVKEDQEHPPQELYSDSWVHGDDVMAERFIGGRELTCAVMGDVALGVIEIFPTADFYDYESKYEVGGSKHVLPAEISPNVYQDVQILTLKAHQALGCRGVSRADFRYDDRRDGTGELICLEVNTQPGMTATSLVPELAAHSGHDFEALVSWILEDASCRR